MPSAKEGEENKCLHMAILRTEMCSAQRACADRIRLLTRAHAKTR